MRSKVFLTVVPDRFMSTIGGHGWTFAKERVSVMPTHPDLIIWRAQIRTLDPSLPFCSAVAVKDGQILATGDDDSIRAMRGAGTTVVDGRGIAFVPGLTDSHIHPLWGIRVT